MKRLKEQIIERFSILRGISISQAASKTELLENAFFEVSQMLLPNIDIMENASLITYLCGAVCCYKETLSASLSQPESIRVSDMSVSQKSSIENAKRIKEEAIITARSILKDESFFFGRTN